jgi:hypothetical protein
MSQISLKGLDELGFVTESMQYTHIKQSDYIFNPTFDVYGGVNYEELISYFRIKTVP